MSPADKASRKTTDGVIQETDGMNLFKQKSLERVIPVRLSEEHWMQIKQEASQMGIGASTLARIWIVASLRKLGNGAEKPKERSRGGQNGTT